MKTIVVIQARMGSSRLPGKIMLPLGDSVVLDYVVRRCRKMQSIAEVIVATTTEDKDQEVADWCAAQGVVCFRGPEDDVLSRYVACADSYQPDYVIRVTSDCPFVDYEFGNAIIEQMLRSRGDIAEIDGKLLPRGLNIEMIAYSALKYVDKHGLEPRHREHVTYFAYEYKELFKVTSIEIPEALRQPQLRITLDTPEDYEMLRHVADHFSGNPLVSSELIVRYLLDHPEVSGINAHIEQKPVV